MPGNVYRIKGSETARSVTIKWTEPPDHGSQIQQYNIEARTMNNPKWRPVATSSLSHHYSIRRLIIQKIIADFEILIDWLIYLIRRLKIKHTSFKDFLDIERLVLLFGHFFFFNYRFIRF